MRTVQAKISNTSLVKRINYKIFMPVAFTRQKKLSQNNAPGVLEEALYQIGYWLMYRNLLDKFGLTGVRTARTGGASISPQMIHYFQSLGVNIEVGYGLSEAPLVATHYKGNLKPETTGPPAVSMEVRLSNDREVFVRV
jgi:long-chain acyl-CoA synthetase